MHPDLLSALAIPSGLVLVTGPTGHGKTTAIEAALADPACPPGVAFLGDLRGDAEPARRAVALAREGAVVAVLRIPRAAASFARLVELGVPAADVARVTRFAFTTRLVRAAAGDRSPPVLLHERIVVTPAIRALIVSVAHPDAIHRQALSDGMRSIRRLGLELVAAGRLEATEVLAGTPPD